MKNINTTMELMAQGKTISQALKEVYQTRHVFIPFNEKDMELPIKALNFNARSINCFEKIGLKTVLDVINYFNKYEWNSIDRFGRGSATDVFEKILDYAWTKLNTKEQAEFLIKVDEDNEPIEV